jgi:FkbM family methyltransferase
MVMQSSVEASPPELVLERIIPPEIKNDELNELIRKLAAREPLRYVLEIGSAAGGGSTEAFVKGLSANPSRPALFCVEVSKPRFKVLQETYEHLDFVHCYNMSTVALEEFPTDESIADFYARHETSLRNFPLPAVLGWLQEDKRYVRDADVESGAIERIREEHGISEFDLVLIDGSEFTGELEFHKIYGAKIILLDDTATYKNFAVRRRLLSDPNYELLADNQNLRNGYSAFRRRAKAEPASGEGIPIHFFTIVLNGEPFIRYHEEVFRRLPFRWHWHIVEGVASLTHDTAWSAASGGHISKAFHDGGRSGDGTTGYLDQLAKRYPGQVSLYRKPRGVFWDGKREMVNAPLASIEEPCLLWQVDADELWTEEQIVTVRQMFMAEPHRTAANYWCWYFIGPSKVIGTRHNYAQNPRQEWLRTWRFEPGDHWAAHEPPTLVRPNGSGSAPIDVARIRPFGHDEMEAAGVVFQHFAYATEEQLRFKETYYGYRNALACWRKLQQHKGSGFLRDYLPWVGDNTMFGEASAYNVKPIATYDATAARWSLNGSHRHPNRPAPKTTLQPRIVVDGIFYQYLASGVSRVWTSLLEEWAKSGFAQHVVVLDRAGTAPRIAGVHYRTIAAHDYRQTGRDSLYLERICRELEADLFISTYYSTPTDTPSVFMGYDMIPEVLGFELADETWKEKHRAIQHAATHIMISANSARDLERLFPLVKKGSTTIAHCGVAAPFHPASSEEVDAFRRRHGLTRPYILTVGERLGFGGYKNGFLLFRAVSLLPDPTQFTVVCVGGAKEIEAPLRALVPKTDVRRLQLDDDALGAAYSGAYAYVCPSRYEGFGMPIVEAMACGCPVVACPTSSIPEVAGDAALFVGEDDAEGLAKALLSLDDPDLRAEYIRRGTAQAGLFGFLRMSQIVAKALLDTAEGLRSGTHRAPAPAWNELRRLQQVHQTAEIRSAVAAAESACGVQPRPAEIALASDDFTRALNVIQAMQRSPFWKLRGATLAVLARLGVRKPTPALIKSDERPPLDHVATAARVSSDEFQACQAQTKPQAPPATDTLQQRVRRRGALFRKFGKLVTGLKALADLRAYYENFQRFEAEIRAQVQQVAASIVQAQAQVQQIAACTAQAGAQVQQVAERVQEVSSSTAKLGAEVQQIAGRTARFGEEVRDIAETTKRLDVAIGTDLPSPEALYYRGLRAVGILNYENTRVSGEQWFLARYLDRHPDATIVDVGANVGRYAEMVRTLAPLARIIAIEPHPGSFEKLARTSQAIGAEALLTAVGAEVGEVAIYDYTDADGSEHASLYREVIEKIHGRPAVSHKVPCEPLDQIAGRLALPSIGLLKIDTEGHELAVLKGAKGLIEASKIDAIQFEFNEMNVISRTFLFDFMEHLPNYRFYRLLPDSAIRLHPYSPRFMEIFAYQNLVCVRSGLDASWIEGAGAA